jgi:CO/xanthine dehydrogenase FAD-binding subunit
VKPAPFTYHRPDTREEVDDLLARFGDEAKVLAGGQSLVPILNMRLANPAHLIDINHLHGEPVHPAYDHHVVAFSPLVRQRIAEHSEVVGSRLPLLSEAMAYVGHPAIRSRGTVVGSIAHADPAAELPAIAVLLDAQMRVRSKSGTRTIAASDFFIGPLENSCSAEEWVEEVLVPETVGRGYAFEEYARRSGDYALCGVAGTAERKGDGNLTTRLAYLGMGGGPVRLDLPPMSEAVVRSSALEQAIAEAVADNLDPEEDLHATAAYRKWLARRLGVKVARRAAMRCEGGMNG